jgi:SAM-dependent methyltransferase
MARFQTRLMLRELPDEELRQGSVLDLPFAEDSFDMMFSHGVLHHVPDIKQAQNEIYRVLRPGGELVIMMYARWGCSATCAGTSSFTTTPTGRPTSRPSGSRAPISASCTRRHSRYTATGETIMGWHLWINLVPYDVSGK